MTNSAFLIPGQGEQDEGLLALLEALPFCRANMDLVSGIMGDRPDRLVARCGSDAWKRNEIASTLMAFVSCGAWHELRNYVKPIGVAGYSVGQWTAMHMAGMLTFEDLINHVWSRAQLMNQSRSARDGSMAAIIGLPLSVIDQICEKCSSPGSRASISNINATGQTTIAGHRQAVERVIGEASLRGAHKVVLAKTAGAWHCFMLEDILQDYTDLLDQVPLRMPGIPVADNVTGSLLPQELHEVRANLAKHMVQAVNWQDCVRTLVGLGSNDHIEVGYGNILTKFGPFIDRRVRHLTYVNFMENVQTSSAECG